MALFDFAKLKAVVGDIAAQVRTLQDKIDALIDEREHLASLPPQRAEMVAVLEAEIDRLGEPFERSLANACAAWAGDPFRDQTGRPALRLLNLNPGGSGSTVQPAALAALLGPVLKEGVRRAIDDMPWADHDEGTRAQRQKRIAALDKQIAKLEGELAELRQHADAAGVALGGDARLTRAEEKQARVNIARGAGA